MGYLIHRDRNKPPTASKGKILKFLLVSLALFALSITLTFIEPVHIIAKYMTRITNGSEMHHLLMQEIDIIHVSTYLFNVTNKERFLSGEDQKLKVQDVGPFTYRELRVNEDFEIDPNDEVMRYTPRIWAEFIPEASIGDPKNIKVIMPNIAMLSLTSIVSKYPPWTRLGYHVLVQKSNSHSFVELDAFKYMWGYEDPLVQFGNTVMPGWITFSTLGVMDRMYDKKKKFRVEVGNKDSNKFEIKTFDGHHGLTMWDYEDPTKRSKCNSFANSYEGMAYPTDLQPEKPIRIYRTVLCRILDLDYVGSKTTDYGGGVFQYKLNNRTFMKDPSNDCMCNKGVCHDGYTDISPCFYDLPFVLSSAHFFGADPEIYSRIEGIDPDPEKFDSRFELDPKIGAVVYTKMSLQLNMLIKDADFNTETKSFSNMLVPLAYFVIETPGLIPEQVAKMKLMYNTGPKVVLAIQVVLSLLGLLLLSNSMRLLYWNWFCNDGKGMAFQVPTDVKNSSGIPLVGYDDT